MEKKRKVLVVVLWKKSLTATEQKIQTLQLTDERGAFWQSVTGGVDEGEDFAAGALREAREETGLDFSLPPLYLGLEHEFLGRWGLAVERAFLLQIFGGENPPLAKLDPTEHRAQEWLEPNDAKEKVKFPFNKDAINRALQAPSPLVLRKNGIFEQDGQEVTHERTVELLHRSLERTPGGHYQIKIGTETLGVLVEDLPRFVQKFDPADGTILLLGGRKEVLNPSSLSIKNLNQVHCMGSDGLPALFLSPAYYELAKSITETSGEYVLHFLGRNYTLPIAH